MGNVFLYEFWPINLSLVLFLVWLVGLGVDGVVLVGFVYLFVCFLFSLFLSLFFFSFHDNDSLSGHSTWRHYTYLLLFGFLFGFHVDLPPLLLIRKFFFLSLFHHLFLRNQVSVSMVIKLRLEVNLTNYHLFRRIVLPDSFQAFQKLVFC